ncbi:NUDIX domain-containing protein [Actinokineospora sp. PR83]|uniref:NUDIX domain-containing protein n=1 Tax=Actinokineospora sp. PR83 TaxID=2884908 RepID=UPI001F1FEBE3|nr:NUDIX domain-containing protein [Actinokineospora sp. PR83]MCG8917087.1 NUDIX domain-containing protein [Actinokineospora sp. PR83]
MTVMENALATAVLVVDDAGLVLMVDRGGRLELPTGAARTGETVVAAAARVVLAQTGVVVAGASLVGLDSAGEFAVVLRARPVDGDLADGAEWVEPERLGELAVAPGVRERVERGLDEAGLPYLR